MFDNGALLVSRAVSETKKLVIGVLGSGRGSNFAAIADAIENGSLNAQVGIVLSDVEDSGILQRAATHGCRHQFIDPGKFRTKLDDEAEAAYIRSMREAKVDVIVLAGFMRILKGGFLREFPNRVLNIHPSLLPSFPGLAAWKQALEYGVKVTGCTVHIVDQGIDTGPILGQQAVAIAPGDTSESLHTRIQEQEHRLAVEILKRLAADEIQIG